MIFCDRQSARTYFFILVTMLLPALTQFVAREQKVECVLWLYWSLFSALAQICVDVFFFSFDCRRSGDVMVQVVQERGNQHHVGATSAQEAFRGEGQPERQSAHIPG